MATRQSSIKKNAILDAATRMFLTYGYSDTSVEGIADAAPVSKPTLYSHFKNKKELFAAVIEDKCKSLLGAMPTSGTHGDNVERSLKAIARAFVELIYSEDGLNIHRLITAESQKFPELGELFYRSGPKVALDFLADYLQELNDTKRLQTPDSALAANLFFSMLKGDQHLQALLGLKQTLNPREKQKLIDAVVSFFIRGHAHVDSTHQS